MPLATDIMKGGFSAISAIALNGQINAAVSAAGTTQGTGTAIAASINVLTTCAAGAGVVLPAGEPGDEVEILNLGAGYAVVYPDSGSRINGLATNGGMQLATNTACKYRRFSSTRWAGYLSA